jgi:hypothetical protein
MSQSVEDQRHGHHGRVEPDVSQHPRPTVGFVRSHIVSLYQEIAYEVAYQQPIEQTHFCSNGTLFVQLYHQHIELSNRHDGGCPTESFKQATIRFATYGETGGQPQPDTIPPLGHVSPPGTYDSTPWAGLKRPLATCRHPLGGKKLA